MTPQRSLGESLAFAAVTAVFSAVPLGRASRRARWATSGAAALVAAPAAAVIVSRTVASPSAPAPRRVVGPAVAGGVAGTAAAGVMAAAFVVDRLMEDALVRRGVRRPRVVIAVASAAISLVADRLDQRFDQG